MPASDDTVRAARPVTRRRRDRLRSHLRRWRRLHDPARVGQPGDRHVRRRRTTARCAQARSDPHRRWRQPLLRWPAGRRRRAHRGAARSDHRADRPERRRQDDLLQPVDPVRHARHRNDHVRRQLDIRSPLAPARRSRDGSHLPAHQGAGQDARDRQHDARRAAPGRRVDVAGAARTAGAPRNAASRNVR